MRVTLLRTPLPSAGGSAQPATRLKGAIVLGGDYRGLGIVRNLGRRGIPIWVVKDRHTVAVHSRYVRRIVDWGDDEDDDRTARLLSLAEDVSPGEWALFPTTDQMTAAVAGSYEQLSQSFVLTTPPPEIVDIGQDKRRTHALAAGAGIRFPATWLPRDLNDVMELDLRYPVIIKPAIKDRENPLTRDKAWRVNSHAELIRQYQVACRLLPADQIMIQDAVPGDGRFQYSYAGVMDRGRPVAEVVAKRLRQYPPDFGLHSTYVVSIEDPEVLEAGRQIVGALKYTGLVEVEFKRDPRDLSLNLLDVNTRVWGWHTLGVRSGVDFIHINWRLLQGETIEPLVVPAGESWVRLLTDCIASAKDIRSGRFNLPGYAKSLFRRHDAAMLSVADPVPAMLDAPMLAYLRWKRALS